MRSNKIWRALVNWDLFIADMMLVILIITTFGGVIFRYCLNKPFDWLEEIQMAAIVWIVFLGSGAAFRQKAHVAVEIVVELFPQNIQKGINVLVSLIVIFILTALTIQSMKYVGVAVMSGRRTSILRIPYSYVYGILPVACIWMIFSYIYGLFTGKRKEEKL